MESDDTCFAYKQHNVHGRLQKQFEQPQKELCMSLFQIHFYFEGAVACAEVKTGCGAGGAEAKTGCCAGAEGTNGFGAGVP